MPILTLVSFIFFTGLVGLITWWITRKDKHDSTTGYFLGGRTLTAGFIAGSLMLTNLSTEQLVGLNGHAFKDGLCVIAWEVIAGLSLVIMALFFLPKYLKSGISTIPEFLENRYNDTTRTITSIIFIFAYMAILLPILLYTGATGLIGILDLKTLTGIQNESMLVLMIVSFLGVVGAIYAIVGGLKTVAVSDTINGFGLLVGGILIAVLGLYAVNDQGIFAALSEMKEAHPEKFNSLGGPEQSVPFSTLFTGVLLLNMFYWCTNQQIIQRTFGASTLKEGQKGVLMAGALKILAPIILVLPGIIAYHLFTKGVLAKAPKADDYYGLLVQHVLPPSLTGFFAAAVVGAILSSFNSALNSTSTLFSLGVYQHMINPNATDKQIISSGKIFGWIITVAAILFAWFLAGKDGIFGYLQAMNALYFIPIFSVVVVGLIFKRVPPIAANIALILGCLLIAAGNFIPTFQQWIADNWNGFHFIGAVFAFLVIMMIIIGAIMPTAKPYEQQDSGDVDLTPWKFAKPVGALLAIIVLSVYVYFADTSVLSQEPTSPTPQESQPADTPKSAMRLDPPSS